MLTFVTIVHVLLCVFMIFVILLQPGKDAGMGAALGGGAATTAFGGRGAVTFLSKLTGICAALFFLTSLGLSFVGLKASVAAGDDEVPAASSTPPPIEGSSSGTVGTNSPSESATGTSGTGTSLEQTQGAPPAPAQPGAEPINAAPHGGTQPTQPPPGQK